MATKLQTYFYDAVFTAFQLLESAHSDSNDFRSLVSSSCDSLRTFRLSDSPRVSEKYLAPGEIYEPINDSEFHFLEIKMQKKSNNIFVSFALRCQKFR